MNDDCRHDEQTVANLLRRYGGDSAWTVSLKQAWAVLKKTALNPLVTVAGWLVVLSLGILMVTYIPEGHVENWSAYKEYYHGWAWYYFYLVAAMAVLSVFGTGSILAETGSASDGDGLIITLMIVAPTAFGFVLYMFIVGFPTYNPHFKAEQLTEPITQFEHNLKAVVKAGKEPTIGNMIAHGALKQKRCAGAVADDDGTKRCLGSVKPFDVKGGAYRITIADVDSDSKAISKQEQKLLVRDGAVLSVSKMTKEGYRATRSQLRDRGSDLKPLGLHDETGLFVLPEARANSD